MTSTHSLYLQQQQHYAVEEQSYGAYIRATLGHSVGIQAKQEPQHTQHSQGCKHNLAYGK